VILVTAPGLSGQKPAEPLAMRFRTILQRFGSAFVAISKLSRVTFSHKDAGRAAFRYRRRRVAMRVRAQISLRIILLATSALLGLSRSPALAESNQYPQPMPEDGFRSAATAVNAERADAFRHGSSAAIARAFTADALFVELLPRLEVMHGRAAIQRHFDELLAAKSNDLSFVVTSAEPDDGGAGLAVGGDYVLSLANRRAVAGHFFQELRRSGNGWLIASEVFARPEPVLLGESPDFRGN
jgi:ketosteroid isomerase-like protein